MKYLALALWMASAVAHAGETAALKARVRGREFPSRFQAWTPAVAPQMKPEAALRAHDLVWMGIEGWGLKPDGTSYVGLASAFRADGIARLKKRREAALTENPHALWLAEVRYNDAYAGQFPDDSPFWKRNEKGQRVPVPNGVTPPNNFYLNFADPALQERVAALCVAVVRAGLDGCMLDWWNSEGPERLALLQKIRAAIGEEALLVGNVNGTLPEKSAPYLNGMFMEGFGASFFGDWKKTSENLRWGQANLRKPAIVALDAWYADLNSEPGQGTAADWAHMRLASTLVLTNSEGYFLFGNGLHAHLLHDFTAKGLGFPTQRVGQARHQNGVMSRDFERGTVYCNPPGAPRLTVSFPEARTSRATGRRERQHFIPPGDGDIFMRDTVE